MIYIYHGENALASRNAYYSQLQISKKRFPLAEAVNLNGEKITLTELTEALEANSLFGNQRIIQIEGLFSRRRSKEKESLIQKLSSFANPPVGEAGATEDAQGLEILIYEPKQITPAVLKNIGGIKNCRISEFKLSNSLFQFLDGLRPENRIQSIKLFRNVIQTDAPELVNFMLIRRVTELLLAVGGNTKNLAGIYQEWQKQKIIQQAKFWKEAQLREFHKRLLEIDEAIKTGSTPIDLATHLDILVGSL